MKEKSKPSLADKIAGILNTAPSNFDPEDEEVDATNAQVVQEFDEDIQEDEEILSQFRRQNVDLLADVDEKYAGKKTSRKDLEDSGSDAESEPTESDGDDDDLDEADTIESGSEENEEEEETDEDEEDASFKHFKETNVSNQIKKGICVRTQTLIWENLLELRIQLQKCLVSANKLPQKDNFAALKQESEFSNKVTETKNSLSTTLDKFLLLQKLLRKQYPETKNLGKDNKSVENLDEEIPSDTENEQSASDQEEEIAETQKGKKRKLSEYEDEISNSHKRYKDYSNKTIQKWNDKTRIAVKGGTSRSVIDQIEFNLSNKEKLIKRTQTRKSQYQILGEEATEDKIEECSPEIFEDDDFYHQLLRELIEVKSADVTDPVQLGQQWIHLQNLRSKMKRKIDTRATKGRKIRYAVHSKLVNFMAPIDGNSWTDEAKNELYNSLFGKNQPVLSV